MLGCTLLTGLLIACGGESAVPIPPGLEGLDVIVRTHLENRIQLVEEERTRESLTELALAYLANDFPTEAAAIFQEVGRLSPNDPLPLYYRALAQAQAGNHQASQDSLQDCVVRWPAFAPARERFASGLLDAGALDEAEREFQEVISREPNEAAGYLGLIEVLLQKGEPQLAFEALDTVRPENAALPQKKLLKGRSLRALGRLEEATPLIESAKGAHPIQMQDAWGVRLELNERDLPRLVDRANRLIQARQAHGAINLLEEVREFHPDNYEVAVNLGVAYLHGGRSAEGLTLLESMVKAQPERFEGHLNLAAIHLEQGDLEAALASAHRAVELAPGVAQAHRTLAKIYERQANHAAALAAFAQAVAVEAYNPVLQVEVAKAALRAGDPVRAEEACRRVWALEPDSITGPLCLGEALRRQERLNDALEALAGARAMDPEHPDVAKLASRLGG